MALTRRYTIGAVRLVDGPTLRRLRTRAALTQAALAAKLGAVPNRVAFWQRNETIAEPMARLIWATLGPANPKRKGVWSGLHPKAAWQVRGRLPRRSRHPPVGHL
jgi:hypothetical protein